MSLPQADLSAVIRRTSASLLAEPEGMTMEKWQAATPPTAPDAVEDDGLFLPKATAADLQKPTTETPAGDKGAEVLAPAAEQKDASVLLSGEFITPAEGAKFMASYGIPQIPLRGKAPFFTDWTNKASCDPKQIDAWYAEYRCNFGSVAKGQIGGFCALETDSGEAKKRFEATGGKFTAALITQSSPGRGHRWYRQTAETIALGNLSQNIVVNSDFSFRQSEEQCVSPGSVHPRTCKQYRVVKVGAPEPITQAEVDFLKSQKLRKEPPTASLDGPKIPFGSHDSTLASIAGKLRDAGMEEESLASALIEICEKRCIDHGPDYESMCEKIAHSICRYQPGRHDPVLIGSSQDTIIDEPDEDIPAFDKSVIHGIYKEFVDVVTEGTTLEPQFTFLLAKTITGIRMAGRVKFDWLDSEPRYYGAVIGETGSGKGEAFRRVRAILERSRGIIGGCGFKIIDSADSGVGIKDLFFELPDQPILCYVDEVTTLGNKSADSRNPGIVDTMVELADSTYISRVLARGKNGGGGSKSKHDARFCTYMCGQDGKTFMKAFAGRTKEGWWDRNYPEYGTPQNVENLPLPISEDKANMVLMKWQALNFSGQMTTSSAVRESIDRFWSAQMPAVRKKARWKKNLILDCYMAAFGDGRMEVSLTDVQDAIKIFTRQLVIRRIHFRDEAPDKIGVYLSRIKAVTQRMVRRLAAGANEADVALSRRDYESKTNAFRDNELHIFSRAWDAYARGYLKKVIILRTNGQKYEKYLPAAQDEVKSTCIQPG